MLNRPSEIEVDDFNNFTNRPMTLEVDSNEFNSFLGKKAKASVAKASLGIKYNTATTSGIIIETAMITGFKL